MAGVAAIKSESKSTSKRLKQNEDKELVDRLSSLPDALVTYILSFLPIKEAVKTCILSKCWQLAWTSVSKLEFIDRDLVPTRLQRNKRNSAKCFEKFVDGVLRACDSSSIKVFKLHCELMWNSIRPWISPLRFRSWISAAIMHHVEELDISSTDSNPIPLPRSLYTCERLRVLRLEGPFTLEVPDVVCLKSLKTLQLDDVDFVESSLNKLLSTCELEDLLLRRCIGNHGWMSSICSTSLKYLSITDWLRHPNAVDCSVVVDTPQLKHIFLSIKDGLRKSYSLRRLPSLCHADFALFGALNANIFVKLLESISNAEILISLPFNFDVLEGDQYQKLPVFYNLKRLAINLEKDSWKMSYLLQQLPNLETFILHFMHDDNEWQEPDNVARCLCLSSHLKEVTINDFKGWNIEMQVVEYLLKNGMALNAMTFYSKAWRWQHAENATMSKQDILRRLRNFPRGSSTCQIRFLNM